MYTLLVSPQLQRFTPFLVLGEHSQVYSVLVNSVENWLFRAALQISLSLETINAGDGGALTTSVSSGKLSVEKLFDATDNGEELLYLKWIALVKRLLTIMISWVSASRFVL